MIRDFRSETKGVSPNILTLQIMLSTNKYVCCGLRHHKSNMNSVRKQKTAFKKPIPIFTNIKSNINNIIKMNFFIYDLLLKPKRTFTAYSFGVLSRHSTTFQRSVLGMFKTHFCPETCECHQFARQSQVWCTYQCPSKQASGEFNVRFTKTNPNSLSLVFF